MGFIRNESGNRGDINNALGEDLFCHGDVLLPAGIVVVFISQVFHYLRDGEPRIFGTHSIHFGDDVLLEFQGVRLAAAFENWKRLGRWRFVRIIVRIIRVIG